MERVIKAILHSNRKTVYDMLITNTLWDMFETELKQLMSLLLRIVVVNKEEWKSLFLPTLLFIMLKQNKDISF